MQDEKQYFYANNKSLAETIRFLTRMSYIEIPHKSKDGRSVFSFHNNDTLQSVLTDIMLLKEKYQK